jgi:hypothetical protein
MRRWDGWRGNGQICCAASASSSSNLLTHPSPTSEAKARCSAYDPLEAPGPSSICAPPNGSKRLSSRRHGRSNRWRVQSITLH